MSSVRILMWSIFLVVLLPDATRLAFAAPRTGTFLHEESVTDIAGTEWAERFEGVVKIDRELTWSVSVPVNYSPERPAGLLVYISPSNSGKMPERWESVLEAQNLIWVSAHKSGNRINPRTRITLALIGPMLIGRDYEIDPSRIYVAGLSGGGRVASIVAPQYPQIFRGALYICGVNSMRKDAPLAQQDNTNNRFVFLTGSRDFNQRETKQIFNQYERQASGNSLYLEVPGMGHENPAADAFAEAIQFLDER